MAQARTELNPQKCTVHTLRHSFATYLMEAGASFHTVKVRLSHMSITTTMILHTRNQRLHFHPHLHGILPGTGMDATDRVVQLKSAQFLVPQPALRSVFCTRFRDGLADLAKQQPAHPHLPEIDFAVWRKDWGVHLQPCGSGENIIKYLGRYLCRTAIGDTRILSVTDTHVRFYWKDRSKGGAIFTENLVSAEFVKKYLRHGLPCGLRAIRYRGSCHSAAADASNPRMIFVQNTTSIITSIFHPSEKATESHSHRTEKRPILGKSTPQTPSRNGENRAKAMPTRKIQRSNTEQSTHQTAPQDKAPEQAQTQNT